MQLPAYRPSKLHWKQERGAGGARVVGAGEAGAGGEGAGGAGPPGAGGAGAGGAGADTLEGFFENLDSNPNGGAGEAEN